MVPEQTYAAQDEPSEEQRSGKALVRARWRGQKGGEQPPGAGRRGTMDSWEMHGIFFCGYLMQ